MSIRGVHARHGLHGRDQFDRRAGGIVEVQRAVLVRRLDERGLDAGLVEMRLGLVEVFVHEHAEADALALRLAGGLLQRERMMRALLDAAQPERVGVLVADDQAHHLGVEVAALREIARREHEMARARDVERRIEVGFRNRHVALVLYLHAGLANDRAPLVELAVDHRAVFRRRHHAGHVGRFHQPVADRVRRCSSSPSRGSNASIAFGGVPFGASKPLATCRSSKPS